MTTDVVSDGGEMVVRLLVSQTVALGQAWHLDLCSPFWRLYVNDGDGAWLECEGKKLLLGKGELWLVPAWTRFRTGVEGAVSQAYLHFEVRMAGEGAGAFRGPIRLKETEVLEALTRQWLLARGGRAERRWGAALAQAAFATVWEEWIEAGGKMRLRGGDNARLQRVLEILEERLQSPPQNGELARLFGCSEDVFIRRFRELTGETPAASGRARRLAAGAELLVGSGMSLEEIAAAVGFSDRFHFSRAFKSKFGLAPALYRRMHQREQA